MKSEWKQKTLGELSAYITKGIPPKYTETESNSTIHVLNQKCNRDFNITFDYSRLHDTSQKKVPDEKLLKIGDVLINSTGTGTAGRVAQLFELPFPTTIDGHMILLRPTSEIETCYFGYAIKQWQTAIEALAEGSTGQTEINRQRLCDEIIITYPSDKEHQKRISSLLFDIDQKIAINNAINENLLQQAVAIHKSWFYEYSLNGGIMPSSWKTVTIEDITCLVSRGIAPKYDEDSDQIILNQKCIRNHTIDFTPSRRHIPKAVTEKWLVQGDLLINSTGQGTLGRVAQVWFEPKNMTVDSHITIVRPKSALLKNYIGFWGITHEAEIEALHTGSTGQTELPRERVKAIEVTLPDEKTLMQFNDVIYPMTQIIVTNQEENERLSLIRDSLLPKLMSGELDVSDLDF